jgi:hypothetical protein
MPTIEMPEMILPLTAADRCDQCPAQAQVRVRLRSGAELVFCVHHARENSSALRRIDADIKDESARLTGTAALARVR